MDGLQFQCVPGCTNCCRVQGWVYITEDDLFRAAAYVNLPVAEFEAKYVVRTKTHVAPAKAAGTQCHFLGEGLLGSTPSSRCNAGCFPFWPELVENRADWDEAGKNCPGIGGGPLIQIGQAMEVASEMRLPILRITSGNNGKPRQVPDRPADMW